MWTLTGFADEISPELDEQVATLAAEEMRYLELRSAWGTNILDLSDDEVDRVKATLGAAGIGLAPEGHESFSDRCGSGKGPHRTSSS